MHQLVIFLVPVTAKTRSLRRDKNRYVLLYGELGKVGAGQYWSPFMDIDVFPNSIEDWGPAGMVFFRNVQVRYMPIQGDTRLTLAVERPGASGDAGVLADRIELQNVKGRSPIPDFTGEYRYGG